MTPALQPQPQPGRAGLRERQRNQVSLEVHGENEDNNVDGKDALGKNLPEKDSSPFDDSNSTKNDNLACLEDTSHEARLCLPSSLLWNGTRREFAVSTEDSLEQPSRTCCSTARKRSSWC